MVNKEAESEAKREEQSAIKALEKYEHPGPGRSGAQNDIRWAIGSFQDAATEYKEAGNTSKAKECEDRANKLIEKKAKKYETSAREEPDKLDESDIEKAIKLYQDSTDPKAPEKIKRLQIEMAKSYEKKAKENESDTYLMHAKGWYRKAGDEESIRRLDNWRKKLAEDWRKKEKLPKPRLHSRHGERLEEKLILLILAGSLFSIFLSKFTNFAIININNTNNPLSYFLILILLTISIIYLTLK